MTDFFVKPLADGGSNSNDGLSWQTARSTVVSAAEIALPGDRVFVLNTHVETSTATRTMAFAGTPSNPINVYSVTDAVTPAVAVTPGAALVSSGGGVIAVTGSVIFHGFTIVPGNGATGASLVMGNNTSTDVIQVYNDCTLGTGSTSTGSSITVGSSGTGNTARSRYTFNNCSIKLTNGSQRFEIYQEFTWRGGTLLGITNLQHLFRLGAQGRGVPVLIEGVDFQGISATAALVNGPSSTGRITFRNCSFPTSWAGQLVTGLIDPGLRAEMHNCDSGDTNYRLWIMAFAGQIRSETANVKTGGASDGVTPISWKVETNANPTPGSLGLVTNEINRWNTKVGTPITVSVDVLTDGAPLTNGELWMEVQYMGTAGVPRSTFISTKVEPLASTVVCPTSNATWNTAGMTSPQKQRLVSAPFTPVKAGAIQVKVTVARMNATVYVDPKLTVT